MKKWLVAALVVVVMAVGYLAVAHVSGGAFWTMGLPLGGERGYLRRQALAFLEDIQFKDFDSAVRYHSPEDQKDVDIKFLLWKLFKLKPEQLDLIDYEVVFAELDSSKLRGRVKVRMTVKELVYKKLRDQEMVLYFYRDTVDGPWFMKFEDSLREADRAPDKKR